MTQVYNQSSRADNEQHVLSGWLINKAEEIPDLNFSIADPADVEQMACLLLGILNFYFGMIDLHLNLRTFIFALIGASAGCVKDKEGWFYLRDSELATHLIDEETKTIGALKKRIQRLRKGLETYQMKNSHRIVLLDTGYSQPILDKEGQVTTNLQGDKLARGIPSRYKLNVLTVALEILREHQTNPKSKTVLKSMARKLKLKLKGCYLTPDSAGKFDPDKKRRHARSSACSYLRKLIEYAREANHDPVAQIMSVVIEVTNDIQDRDEVDLWIREQIAGIDESSS